MKKIEELSRLIENAAMSVYIMGLAYCSEIPGGWHVRFIHPAGQNHDLNIQIRQEKIGGENAGLDHLYSQDQPPNTRIDIKSEAVLPLSGRHEASDEMNLDSVIDMKKLHGPDGVSVPTRPPAGVGLTDLFIPGAIFYTAAKTRDPYDIVPHHREFPKNHIGNVIGADIAFHGDFTINGLKQDDEMPLPYSPNARYIMIFDNTCRLPICKGREDFHLYYSYLSAEVHYKLEKRPVGIRPINDDAACNPVTG